MDPVFPSSLPSPLTSGSDLLSTEASDGSSWCYGGSLRYTPSHVLKEEWEKRREAIKRATVPTTSSFVSSWSDTFLTKGGAQEQEKEGRKEHEEEKKREDGVLHGAPLKDSVKGSLSVPSLCSSYSLSMARPAALYRLRLLFEVIRFGDRPRHPSWILLARKRKQLLSISAGSAVPPNGTPSHSLFSSSHSPSLSQGGTSSGSLSSLSFSDHSSFLASSSTPPSVVYEWVHDGVSRMLSMLRTMSLRVQDLKKKKTCSWQEDAEESAAMDVFGSFPSFQEASCSSASFPSSLRKNFALLYCMLDALRLEMEDIWCLPTNHSNTGHPPPHASGPSMGAASPSSSIRTTGSTHALEAVRQNVIDRATIAMNAFEWTVVCDILLTLDFPSSFASGCAAEAYLGNASSSAVSGEHPKMETKGSEGCTDFSKAAVEDNTASSFGVTDPVTLPAGSDVSASHPVLHQSLPIHTATGERKEGAGRTSRWTAVPHPTPQTPPERRYSLHFFCSVLEVLDVCRAVMAEAHWPSQLLRESVSGFSPCSPPTPFLSAPSPFVAYEQEMLGEWWDEDTTKEEEDVQAWLLASPAKDGNDIQPTLGEENVNASPDSARCASLHSGQAEAEKESEMAMRRFHALRWHTKAEVRHALRESDASFFPTTHALPTDVFSSSASSSSSSSSSSFSSSSFLVEGTRVIAMNALSALLAADNKNLLGGATRPSLSVLAMHWRECASSASASSSFFPLPFPSLPYPSSLPSPSSSNVSRGRPKKFFPKAAPLLYVMGLVWGGAYQREGLVRVMADVQLIFLHLRCVMEEHSSEQKCKSSERRTSSKDGLSDLPSYPTTMARRRRSGCTCPSRCFSFLPDSHVSIEEVEYLWNVWQHALRTSHQEYVESISSMVLASFPSTSCTSRSAEIFSASSFLWSSSLHPPSIFDLFPGIGAPFGRTDALVVFSSLSASPTTSSTLTSLQLAALRVVTALSELPHDLPPPYGAPFPNSSDRQNGGTTTKNAGGEGKETGSFTSSRFRSFSAPFSFTSTAPHFTSVLLWIARNSFTIHPSRLEAFTAVRLVLDRLVNSYIQENGPTHPYSTALAALRQKLVLIAKQEKLL